MRSIKSVQHKTETTIFVSFFVQDSYCLACRLFYQSVMPGTNDPKNAGLEMLITTFWRIMHILSIFLL